MKMQGAVETALPAGQTCWGLAGKKGIYNVGTIFPYALLSTSKQRALHVVTKAPSKPYMNIGQNSLHPVMDAGMGGVAS